METNSSLSIMNRASRPKVNKKTDLNNTINQLDLRNIYWTPPNNSRMHILKAHKNHSAG